MLLKRFLMCSLMFCMICVLCSCGCSHKNTENRNSVAAICEQDGYTGDVFCLDCEEYVLFGEIIPAKSHQLTVVHEKSSTCSEHGYTGNTICSECNKIISVGSEIPLLSHQTELVGEKASTCSELGYTGDMKCSVCDQIIEQGSTIQSTPHDWEIFNSVESTCVKNGYEGDLICKSCGKEARGQTLNVVDHKFENDVCVFCGWIPAGLYVGNEMIMSWDDLKSYGYVTVSNGILINAKGNFQNGKLVIGEDVTYIDGNYYSGVNVNTLKEIWIPRTVTELGRYLLYSNKSITDVVLFCQIETIPDSAFLDAVALTKIVLPDSVKNISQDAFSGCINLKSLNWPASLKTIGRWAFSESGLTHIIIPEGVEKIGDGAFSSSSVEVAVFPSSVVNIEGQVFSFCDELLSVDLSKCSQITHLNDLMFSHCKKLNSVKLPPELKSTGDRVFLSCENLKFLSLPDGFTTVEGTSVYGAFRNTKLTEVVIPISLIDLGNLVNCPITKIYYRGSEAQWKMTTGYSALPNATIIYNYQPN